MGRLFIFLIGLVAGAFAGYWATTHNMLPPGVPGMATESPPPIDPTSACPPAPPTESPPPIDPTKSAPPAPPTESPPPIDPTK